MQNKYLYSTKDTIENGVELENNIEPVEFIKSFFPLTLIRHIYLTFRIFSNKSLINHAASGAFYFLLSVVPLALFFVFILDSWLSNYGKVSDYFFYVLSEINPEINRVFFENLGLLKGSGNIYGVIGIAGLLWSARLIFTSIRNGFDVIFINSKKRGVIKHHLLSLIFLPIILIATIIFLLFTTMIHQLNRLINMFELESIIDISFLSNYSYIYTVILSMFIVFVLYKFIPNIKIKGSYAFIGAVFFIVSMFFTQKIFILFISWSKYQILYGVISTLIIALLWAYIFFTLFYFFAVFIYVKSHFKELEFVKWYSIVNKSNNHIYLLDKLLFSNSLSSMKKYQIYLSKDDIIYSHGEKGGYIYVLLSGIVFLEKDGKFIYDIPVYSFFGESGILHECKYNTCAVCKVPGYALKIPQEMYNKIVTVSPDIYENMITYIVARHN